MTAFLVAAQSAFLLNCGDFFCCMSECHDFNPAALGSVRSFPASSSYDCFQQADSQKPDQAFEMADVTSFREWRLSEHGSNSTRRAAA